MYSHFNHQICNLVSCIHLSTFIHSAVLAMPSPSAEVKRKFKKSDVARGIIANVAGHQGNSLADCEISCAQTTAVQSEVQEFSSGKLARVNLYIFHVSTLKFRN